MKRTLTTVVVLALAAVPLTLSADGSRQAAPPTASARTRPVTVDDVLSLKAVGAPSVSPDGTQVIYTVRAWEVERDRHELRTHVWKVPVGGGVARQMTYGERGDSQPAWSPDGRFISFVSARGAGTGDETPRPQIYLMRVDGGEASKLTEAKEGVTSYSWAPDSTRIAYVTNDPRSAEEEAAVRKRDDERIFEGDFRWAHLWTIAVDGSGPATRITEGASYTIVGSPAWSPDGKRLAFTGKPTAMTRDDRTDIYIADLAVAAVTKISTNVGSDSSPQWSPDGTTIAWTSEPSTAPPIGDGTYASYIGNSHLVLYNVAQKTARDVSNRAYDGDVGTPQWTADGKQIVFVAGKRTYTEIFSFDIASGNYAQLTRGKTLSFGSRSKDGRVVVVTMDSPQSPGEIYATDASYVTFRKLTDTNPQTAEFALGDTEVVTWKSSDGFDVEGVLLKPVGFTAGRKYPTLIVAHGGPAGAYVNNYRVGGLEGGQLWAGQGWAVFYPNPRGSTNYGEKFLRANVNDWGGGDYRDIMTGVDALVAKGIADPDRLAHIGWSYGGYMTAWVVTQTNRFKAAMVGAGLTNMTSMYGTNDIPNVLITYFGGYPTKTTTPLYTSRSAMTFIDNVQTPTLILHGGNDERVPTGQAYELFRGLKDRGKVTELVFYPREGHGISEYHHQKDRLTRIHGWVTRYTLGSGKTTTQ